MDGYYSGPAGAYRLINRHRYLCLLISGYILRKINKACSHALPILPAQPQNGHNHFICCNNTNV
jgi:hypothetical protein